ncbi:hypothetical protein [Vagococcus silagei]|uniref:Uncharacterized protein n=1 Tax=Vagococcus silagei TaxID=2508885 RepID=A0A4S3B1S3_9ENTE|nr:hypothetical protein [Vagococcus silagei]THB60692.1 hypothetical protein ESZ54_08855 [Vagococcus silagei]
MKTGLKEVFIIDKKLFQSGFEESRKIVRKSILKREGDVYSMGFMTRLGGTLIAFFVFGILLFALGIGMPKGFLESSPESIFVISYSIVLLIYVLFFVIGIFDLLMVKYLKQRIIYGNIFILTFGLLTLFSILPLIVGLSIDGTGILGSTV